MKFTATLQLPFIDNRAFLKSLDETLTDLLTESITAWLQVSTTVVPVWSGAARSTFRDLASRINFSFSTHPVSSAPDRRALGTSQGFSELEIDKKRGIYGFTYITTLDHLIENETSVASIDEFLHVKTPYNFRDKAARAWEDVAANAEIPDIGLRTKKQVYG